jgi:hypothetical protein
LGAIKTIGQYQAQFSGYSSLVVGEDSATDVAIARQTRQQGLGDLLVTNRQKLTDRFNRTPPVFLLAIRHVLG